MDNISIWRQAVTPEVLSSLDPAHLGLILFPTELCNCRCPYCYQDFSHGPMSPTTVTAIKRLITARSGDIRSLSIGWFGGEPLLAKKIIYEICDHILAVLKATAHPVLYDGFMTTNGYLLDATTVAALATRGVTRFQITLDGPRQRHDESRHLTNGRGTFERIWRNLMEIRTSNVPVKVLLRLHFHEANLADLPKMIQDVNTAFARDNRFHAFMHAVEDLGGGNTSGFKCGNYTDTLDTKRGLEQSLDPSLLVDPVGEQRYVCYASKPNVFCIRANGSIAKCTVALDAPVNCLGALSADGTLHLDHGLHSFWIRGVRTLKPDDLMCPYDAYRKRLTQHQKETDGGQSD